MQLRPIGLTNHVEIIIMNSIGYRSFGQNKTEIIDHKLFPQVKYLLGYCGLKTADYDIYEVIGWITESLQIQPSSRDAEVKRKSRFLFVNKQLDIEETTILKNLKKFTFSMPGRQIFSDGIQGQ